MQMFPFGCSLPIHRRRPVVIAGNAMRGHDPGRTLYMAVYEGWRRACREAGREIAFCMEEGHDTMGMRVLVVGAGGREHAIAWKLSRSERVHSVLCAPGNPGIADVATCFPVQPMEIEALVDLAQREGADLVVVGPEDPLAAGMADALIAAGIPVAGPRAAAARLEASKSFAKEVMEAAGVPTARSITVSSREDGVAAIREIGGDGPVVVKADGLAAGKGVVVALDSEEAIAALDAMLVGGSLGDAGSMVVIEEFLQGPEVSILSLTDGTTITPLAPSCDYKRAYDGDEGPNTGGMGAYTPTRLVDGDLMAHIHETILQPTIDEMARRGRPMQGVLYAGLILTEAGPKVLEFNCRFGDPETQVVLPTLESDLGVLLEAVANGTLGDVPAPVASGAAVGVILASPGYPGSYPKGVAIDGLDRPHGETTIVFQAGTARDEDGGIVTNGGRVVTVVGLGDSIAEARFRAYAAADTIGFDGLMRREDIALREA
jgi:phosphoribosylamine---glycine ligase